MAIYKRTLGELKASAVLHWPVDIIKSAVAMSALPLLLETQDAFIAVLKVSDREPLAWEVTLGQNNSLSGPLFLKHLMVLADLGGEALNKLPPLSHYCPEGVLSFSWNGTEHQYRFGEIGGTSPMTNSALKVDSKSLLNGGDLSPKMKDAVMLLLFGSSAINDTLPGEVKGKCSVGSLLGRPHALDAFVKSNYLRVSKQVSGATANARGQCTQAYVVEHLRDALPGGWVVTPESTLPGVAHCEDGGETNFDVVVKSPQGQHFGIEVSFQVTTNSVIERKSRESGGLMERVHLAGHDICYVIDGAGNINIREHAVGILCGNSDCTVTVSAGEILHLANYMKDRSAGLPRS